MTLKKSSHQAINQQGSLFWLLACALLIIIAGKIEAEKPQPTNRNPATDFFDQQIEAKAALEADLDRAKSQAAEMINSQQGIEAVGTSLPVVKNQVRALEKIEAGNLESGGLRERARQDNTYWDRLEVDYSDPKVANHQQDLDKIASSSEQLIKRLIEELRDFGVDCQAAPGYRELAPEYYLDIQKTRHQDTIYNRHICQQRRNNYHCQQALTVKCLKTNWQYGPWQPKELAINGRYLYDHHRDLGWSVKWKHKRHGWHISGLPGPESPCSSAQISAEIRSLISSYLRVKLEQVQEVITFPAGGRGTGNINALGSRWRVAWDQYIFKYYYRDAEQVCQDWRQDWHERCKLQ